MPTLKQWSIREGLRLQGRVYGDDRFAPGFDVLTTPVIEVIGDRIVTRSGSIYTLDGPPEPGFARYLDERPFKDPTNPLTAAVDRAIAKAKERAP